jgi:hypothetical protein
MWRNRHHGKKTATGGRRRPEGAMKSAQPWRIYFGESRRIAATMGG